MKGIRLKRNLAFVFTGTALVFSLAGCGDGAQNEQLPSDTIYQASSDHQVQDIQPDIHTNVPPPGSEDSTYEEMAHAFFEKKESFDSFSPELKAVIIKNLEDTAGSNGVDGFDGAGSGDAGSSGDGSASPDNGTSPDSGTSTDDGTPPADPTDSDSGSSADPQVVMTLLGGTFPLVETDENCDPTAEFLCIDGPRSPDGGEIYTVQAGVDVVVRMDLNQLAVFGATDPVAVVSVFNNDSGGAASEILIMPEDVEGIGDDIGQFQSAIGLGGFGRFTIVVSAYRSSNEGQVNELFSKMVEVFRTAAPEIEFVEARPVTSGTFDDPVEERATVSSESLQLKVKLLTPFSPGVQVRFENYDEDGNLKGFDAVGYLSPKQAQTEDGEKVYAGTVVLHQGSNLIRMVATNPELDQLAGEDAPDPQVLEFEVFNFFGAPQVKVLSPDPQQALITQTAQNGQKVEIEFCYTVIPDKIETNAGGSEGGKAPSLSGECITGSLGFESCLLVNGRQVEGDDINYNAATGTFTARVTPDFGVNLYQINVTEDQCNTFTHSHSGTFLFGRPLTLIEEGELASEDTFTRRGIQVDIDKEMVEGDIKELVLKFVNRPDTSDMVLKTFKKTATTPGYVCRETEELTRSGGNVSIEFIPETFELGSIELTSFETSNDGMLHLGARINGMHGEADMVDLNGPVVTYGGKEISFIPLSLSIARMDVNLGVTFRKNEDGILELDLKKISGKEVVEVIGDGPLGSFVTVNTQRNPFAAGLDFLDQQQGLVRKLFNNTLNGTFLCGIENGLNHDLVGVLGKAAGDIEKLTNYDKNPFRLSLNLDLLGKSLSLDAALNLLRGDIKIDAEGIHLREIPVRVNPGPRDLNQIIHDFPEESFASVYRFLSGSEAGPQKNLTNSIHKLGLLLSEDVINQALFGSMLAGVLDLELDANFYTQHEIIPNLRILPNGSNLAPDVDINRDGIVDETDQDTPVMLQLKPDKRTPPMLTFLSPEQVAALAQEEAESDVEADADSDASLGRSFFVEGGNYFRLGLTNLEIAAFKQEFVSEDLGGSRTYCKKSWTDDPAIPAKGFCSITADALVDDNEDPLDLPSCEDGDLVSIPRRNGATLSHQAETAENRGQLAPLYRVRLNLIAHGKFSGINRERSAKELLSDPQAPVRTVLHLQFAPGASAKSAFIPAVEVLENNTNLTDSAIASIYVTILNGAVGSECQALNELRIPIPDKFEFEAEENGLLSDLGLESLDLGSEPEELPEIFIDENGIFLDVLLFADLNFSGDGL